MTTNTGFFKTYYDRERGWMWNGHPVKMISGTEMEIKDKNFIKNPNLQKVLTDTAYDTAKSMSDMEKLVFRDIFLKTDCYKRLPTKSRMSRRDRYNKKALDNDVRKIMNLDTKPKPKGRGVEKIIIPSNIIDIYTRLEILLGLKLSGHSDTLAEASALIDQLYKVGEIQNKEQNRKAFKKFSSLENGTTL